MKGIVNMTYEIEIIRAEQLQTTSWSGGTTTQLAIYPKDAVYSERNFKWRLSSAKVETEESVFTSLPGINRIIMIIEGTLILDHEGHHRSILKPFEQDHFSGSWSTKSFGKVVDFNLMMAEGCKGELEAIHINKGQSSIISFDGRRHKERVQAIYCVNGQVSIKAPGDDIFTIQKGDIFLVTAKGDFEKLMFEILNEKDKVADLIKAGMCYEI